jgi:hypothetical protein
LTLERVAWASARARRPNRIVRQDPVVPQIDDCPTDGPPGRTLQAAWVELTMDEAYELLASLQIWAKEMAEGRRDPGWHTHVSDDQGRELSISIRLDDGEDPDGGQQASP